MQVEIAPRTGLRLKNPVIASSGTFGYGVEAARRMDVSGLGAIVSKGTTLLPRPGNEPMRLWETTGGMLNAIGLQNIGVDAVIRDKAPVWAGWSVPVLVNVSGGSVDEYVEIVRRLDGIAGVAGIELNVSCPNVKEGGTMFGSDPAAVAEVTDAVRRYTQLPLIVKLSPNVTDIKEIACAAVTSGADALSLINTVYGMAIDARLRRAILPNVSGGLSGPAVKPLALYLVYQVAQVACVPIIAYGGIMSAGDAVEFMLAGACAVGLGTALMVNPLAWREIVNGIRRWCEGEGVHDLREIIGAANPGFGLGAGNDEPAEQTLGGLR